MPDSGRTVRVFVSSTFRDMQVPACACPHADRERDLLIKKVFPQLRKLCEERAVAWTEVDLRWGITTEEAAEGKVLPLCLAEIQRCRPYFIGLLGERYGWVPDAIPPELIEREPWLAEHQDHSVTELEILHGVLRDPAMADRATFYVRGPAYLTQLPAGADPADFAAESPAAARKLASLKDRIRAAHAAGHLRYPPREPYPDPAALGALILADFTALVEQLYPTTEVPDPLDQEALRHEAYAISRRLALVGRDALLRQIDKHVTAPGAPPLVLTGESGCGKSALLAEWAARWRAQHPDALIIQHYTGSTPESADWQGLVRRLLGELQRACAIPDEIPLQPEALRTALQEWLTRAAGHRRVVLVLDGLNQLSADDPTARQLGWLPVAVPRNVQLLVSSLPGDSLDALRRRTWPEVPVPLFGPADIAPAAQAYVTLFSKTLPPALLTRLEATPAAANPLYLRAVLDELRQVGRHEELAARAAEYLAAPDLFDRILTRWQADFGQETDHPDLVRRTLCLLACGRFGLAETELLDLLGKGDEPLPRRHWTPLYLAAENALTQRAGLLTFGHDYLRAAVHRRWLPDDAAAQPFRRLLAEYFGKLPDPTDRKLDELPALLRDTAQWERLKDLLADLPTFLRLRGHGRWTWELHGYWLALAGRFDPVEVYGQVLAAVEPDSTPERLASLLTEVASFHGDAGRYAGAEPLDRRALAAQERVLGPEHPNTLLSVHNLAVLFHHKGDYAGAEPLLRRVVVGLFRISQRIGREHPNFQAVTGNYVELLMQTGLSQEQAIAKIRKMLGQ